MSLLKIKEGKETLKRVSLKKVMLGFGHDKCGAFAEFYLDGKKMGEFNDDGYGGETDIDYVSDAHKTVFEKFLKDNNVAQAMFDNGWDFMGSVDKIDLRCQAETVINDAINLKEEEKMLKKAIKDCECGIMIKTEGGYSGIRFKLPLKAISLYKDGVKFLQEKYNSVKANLKEGEYIINTNLEELGVVL